MKKNFVVFLGIIFWLLIVNYSFANNNDVNISQSKTYDTLSQCNLDLEEYSISNPDLKRSSCYASW